MRWFTDPYTPTMDRVWQWAWDRHGPRYSWVVFAVSSLVIMPMWVISALVIVEFEKSDRFLEASALAAALELASMYLLVQPGSTTWRPVERWAAGERIDRLVALESTYSFGRNTLVRGVVVFALVGAMMCLIVGARTGADTSRLIQYGIAGMTFLASVQLIGIHAIAEVFLRPPRIALAGDSEIGDALPRSRPSFATWSNIAIIATAWAFAYGGIIVAAAVDWGEDDPVFAVVLATVLTSVFAVPITVGSALAPSLRPIRDLAEGTERVAAR